MELKELRSLVLLAELGSIQLVSEKCGRSPGAVHKRLKLLEEELGARLYEKQGRRLVLTPVGEMALPYLRDMLAQGEAAKAAVAEWKAARRGVVRVGAGPSFCAHLLPLVIEKYRKQHPRVDLFVETGGGQQLLEGLRNRSLDLVFHLAAGTEEEQDLEVCAQWESEIVLAGPARARRGRWSARDIEGWPFLLFRKGSPMASLVGRYLAEMNIRPAVVMRSDSAEAIKAMVMRGMGLTAMFRWTVEPELAAGALRVIRTDLPPLRSRMSLLRWKLAYAPEAVRAFIGTAREAKWKHLRAVEMAAGAVS